MTDSFNLEMVEKMVKKAQELPAPIRPDRLAGEEFYFLMVDESLLTPEQRRQLQKADRDSRKRANWKFRALYALAAPLRWIRWKRLHPALRRTP